MMRLHHALLTVILAGAIVWPAAVAFAQSPADVAAARELYIEGAKLSKQEKWGEAEDRLSRSLALKRAPITHYSLGVVQNELGKLLESLENFRAFLAAPVEEATSSLRDHAERFVADLTPRVAKVRVSIQPAGLDGLEVAIDGVPVPLAALGRPRLVNPGTHEVTATAEGYQQARTSVSVPEGGAAEARVVLQPAPHDVLEPQQGPSAPAPSPNREPNAEGSFPIAPVVLLATGAAAIGVGLAVGWVGVGEADAAPTQDGPEADGARTKTIAGDVVAGVGIAAAAAGVIWLIVEATDDDGGADRTVGIHPWSAGALGGVAASF